MDTGSPARSGLCDAPLESRFSANLAGLCGAGVAEATGQAALGPRTLLLKMPLGIGALRTGGDETTQL
ncbi:hypothetical protein CJU94_33935 (plasmid) [Paraburkholderia aromaticivorans]|uniref:Uncharacterized protein n=1 Tax=Paraburkholderia aromaticivorans TaxID=2026199 RepID=A0A248VWE8_9BURK|nr:hypothetical protein CJU94_33935 [Paraburkholderia aromaticivorans]